MAICCIGGGNRSTRKEQPIYRKSLTLYHIMLFRVHLAWTGFKLTTLVVIGTDCIAQVVVNPTTIRSWTRRSLLDQVIVIYLQYMIEHIINLTWMLISGLIDWLIFSANFSSISAMSWYAYHRETLFCCPNTSSCSEMVHFV